MKNKGIQKMVLFIIELFANIKCFGFLHETSIRAFKYVMLYL